MQHTLPKLNYEYANLEPHIDARTMEIHHTKHHAGYVSKLNGALEAVGGPFGDLTIENLLRRLGEIPEAYRTAVRNNGGGHYNHNLFWSVMSPNGGGEPTGGLRTAIEKSFDSFAEFKKSFSEAAATRFGSGWAWLSLTPNGLVVSSSANQDNPIIEGSGQPILGLDVWEHAYYLNYQNRRPDYIEAWWNVVDWNAVAARYEDAISG